MFFFSIDNTILEYGRWDHWLTVRCKYHKNNIPSKYGPTSMAWW